MFARQRLRVSSIVESVALLVSPAAAFFGLRLRLMPVPDLNDPAMHTTFMIDPSSIFLRYTAAFTPTERLREGYRVGLLIPGRIFYLLFGALPGFVVFRYVLALIAVVPAYLLLRRIRGRAAGAAAAVVILSSPVIITAWGTDFPDAVAVSYLLAGLACLAMPSARHRPAWLIACGAFFTLAVWSFGSSLPLVLVTVAAYGLIRFLRDREKMVRDAAVMAGTALAMSALLAVGSAVLIGPFDYIIPTIRSLIYLSHKSLTKQYHSTNWRWAPYVAYLLVPPAVVAAGFIAFGRHVRAIPTPQLIVGAACTAQLAACALLQFAGSVQVLEEHYFSSLLWAAVSLLLAITLVELGRPILRDSTQAWVLPLLLLLVPLAYELDPHVPAFGWLPMGVVLAVAVVGLALIARLLGRVHPGRPARAAGALVLALIAGGLLVVTVAPIPAHPQLPDTTIDPPPAYASALGGDASYAVDLYAATAQLPLFVGPATYSGEQLLMWWPRTEQTQLLSAIGYYHAFFDSIPGDLGTLSSAGQVMIDQRKPAQILLISLTGDQFAQSVAALAPYQPQVERTGILRSGSVAIHVWLIDLANFFRASAV